MEIKNFRPYEMFATTSDKDNLPASWEQFENVRKTAEMLQKIRDKFGFPIKVNSAFRSPAVNAAVGGVANSAHLSGLAADIRPVSPALKKELANVIDACVEWLGIDQVIYYGKKDSYRFVHLGWSKSVPRGEVIVK